MNKKVANLHKSYNIQTTLFCLERFPKKLADDQFSSITKDSIYHIKHMYIQPFTSGGLTRNWMFKGSIYIVLHLQILCFDLVGQTSNYFMQFILHFIVCHVNNLVSLVTKSCINVRFFSFWKVYVSLQPYLKPHFGPGPIYDSLRLIGSQKVVIATHYWKKAKFTDWWNFLSF